jgi:hypothetical protein
VYGYLFIALTEIIKMTKKSRLLIVLPLLFETSLIAAANNLTVLDPNVAPVTKGDWYRPPIFVSWQWQLMGKLNTAYDVELYDIDLFDTDASQIRAMQSAGKRVICYFSAGSYENWRPDADDFNMGDYANTLDGWEDERWLDIRSANVQSIMKARLDLAIEKGCDGVEPDNMDGYSNNTGLNLTSINQLAYNRFIANHAHYRGLSVALKNDLDQIDLLVEYFDFAVNEQCFEYNECDMLSPFTAALKPVLNAEYSEEYVNDISQRYTLCTQSKERRFSTLVLPLDLDDSYRKSCL